MNFFYAKGFLLLWLTREDASCQVSVDPADYAGIHISDLEQVVNARVTGMAEVAQRPLPDVYPANSKSASSDFSKQQTRSIHVALASRIGVDD